MTDLEQWRLYLPWLVGGSAFLLLQWLVIYLFLGRKTRATQRKIELLDMKRRHAMNAGFSRLEAQMIRLCELQRDGLKTLAERSETGRLPSANTGQTPGSPHGLRLEKKHQVVSLAQMGFNSRDISRKLRLCRGETELLLGLCGRFATGESDARNALQ